MPKELQELWSSGLTSRYECEECAECPHFDGECTLGYCRYVKRHPIALDDDEAYDLNDVDKKKRYDKKYYREHKGRKE